MKVFYILPTPTLTMYVFLFGFQSAAATKGANKIAICTSLSTICAAHSSVYAVKENICIYIYKKKL